MPVAYRCRRCKGPPLPVEPEGPCPNCGGFYNHTRVFVSDGEVEEAEAASIEDDGPISAGDLMLAMGDDAGAKTPTGLAGVDWIFDGGLPQVGGGAVLFCGEAGAGKSSLLMVLFRALALRKINATYISAEQDKRELGRQFSWLGKFPSKRMLLHHAVDRDEIVKFIEENHADVYGVDSLHTVENVTDADGRPFASGGSHAVAQVGMDLKKLARQREAIIFAVGHVNLDGSIAGGTSVRHKLDATLVLRYWPGLSPAQKETDPRRILGFEGKTRFGPRGRRALFLMTEKGFEDRGPLNEDEEADLI